MVFDVLLCFLMFFDVLRCSSMFFDVLRCSSMFFIVLRCSLMFFYVLRCFFMFFNVFQYSSMFCDIRRCSLMFFRKAVWFLNILKCQKVVKEREGFKTSEMDARIMLTMQTIGDTKNCAFLLSFFSPNWLIYSKLKKALFILQIDNFLMAS